MHFVPAQLTPVDVHDGQMTDVRPTRIFYDAECAYYKIQIKKRVNYKNHLGEYSRIIV